MEPLALIIQEITNCRHRLEGISSNITYDRKLHNLTQDLMDDLDRQSKLLIDYHRSSIYDINRDIENLNQQVTKLQNLNVQLNKFINIRTYIDIKIQINELIIEIFDLFKEISPKIDSLDREDASELTIALMSIEEYLKTFLSANVSQLMELSIHKLIELLDNYIEQYKLYDKDDIDLLNILFDILEVLKAKRSSLNNVFDKEKVDTALDRLENFFN